MKNLLKIASFFWVLTWVSHSLSVGDCPAADPSAEAGKEKEAPPTCTYAVKTRETQEFASKEEAVSFMETCGAVDCADAVLREVIE
jgi:hypothetical protein